MPTMTAKPDRSLMVRALAHSMMEDALSDFALLGRAMPSTLAGIGEAIPLHDLGNRFEETTLQGNTPQWSVGHGGDEGQKFRAEALELFEKMIGEGDDFTANARRKLEEFRTDPDAKDWDTQVERLSVVLVFKSQITSALPARRILEIAEALSNRKFSPDRIRKATSFLVRSKILRSRQTGGETHWEVNA